MRFHGTKINDDPRAFPFEDLEHSTSDETWYVMIGMSIRCYERKWKAKNRLTRPAWHRMIDSYEGGEKGETIVVKAVQERLSFLSRWQLRGNQAYGVD